MNKRFTVAVLYSSLGVISASGVAMSEPIGRFECGVVGPVSQEPIGDRDGHRIVTVQFSCLGVDGLMKGALYSGLSTSEWDGSQGKYYTGGGTVRTVGGLAVTLLTEGVGTAIMKDGKPAGTEASGKGVFKFASGTLAALSGKTDRWQARPAGFGRFTLEVMTDDEPGTVGTSQK